MKLRKLLKKISIVDYIIILTVITSLIIGYLTYKKVRQTSDKQIVSTSQISFDVFVRGFTYTGENFPIKQGEQTFITIRNVPYTELNIKKVDFQHRKTSLSQGNNYKEIDDPAFPNLYDLVVTVTDEAKITKDGPVVGGNKIKTGLPITIEGATYKVNGTVSNVEIAKSSEG